MFMYIVSMHDTIKTVKVGMCTLCYVSAKEGQTANGNQDTDISDERLISPVNH